LQEAVVEDVSAIVQLLADDQLGATASTSTASTTPLRVVASHEGLKLKLLP